jgi:16S rRNA (cytosine967-C5)-methyltransferase
VSDPSTARSVALEVVRRVIEHDAYSNLAVAAALARSGLPPRERALVAELAYGTIRRLLPIDHALARLTDRPLAEAPAGALAALRLGAYQLLFTRIPAHAAVAETVSLAPQRQRGFVNAVLRRLSAEPLPAPAGDTDEDVSLRTGLAPWAVRELRGLLPHEEVEAAAEALGARAPIGLRVNTCRASVEALEERLAEAGASVTRGRLVPDALLLEAGAPADLPGFTEGWFAVQDQASTFVVGALGPEPGERVLDACAGPGGKSGHIACLVGSEGSAVASDASVRRAGLVRGAARRLGGRVLVLAQDVRRPALRGPFDRVLVDAPCSGIGSARRRPELLWRGRRREVAELARLQVGIATAVADLVRPGGRLLYSVCTFPQAETDAVCDALVRRRPDLEPEPIAAPDGPAERVRLWPHRHGCDAMFLASFRRNG